MKTLVIGLDGATWRIITPLLKKGKLPHIKKLINEGVSGKLFSVIPPMTPPAWASIITGVNPGKHGVYDFVIQDPKSYKIIPVNFSMLKSPPIWEIFNAFNKKVGFVNFPLSFPPPSVESFFISGIGTPESSEFAHPKELNSFLKSFNYKIYPDSSPKYGEKQYFEEVKKITEIQTDISLKLLKDNEIDLFWIVFQGLDWIQHYLWDSKIDGKNAVEEFYCYLDGIIGRFLKEVKDEWNILILSDHGFKRIKGEIHLNNILKEWGYLRRNDEFKVNKKNLIYFMTKILRIFNEKAPYFVKKLIKLILSKRVISKINKLQNFHYQLHNLINWEKTKLFSFGYMGHLYVHVSGKYPYGRISTEQEYKKIIEEVKVKLKSLKDPDTGSPIIGEVFYKDEIYNGPETSNAPDIVCNSFNFDYMIYGDFEDDWFHSPKTRIADHDMEGIIIMKGKYFKKNYVKNISVLDITPTLLYLHNLPILENMDGEIIINVFEKKFVNFQKKKILNLRDFMNVKREEYLYDEIEQKEIEKRLSELGYM